MSRSGHVQHSVSPPPLGLPVSEHTCVDRCIWQGLAWGQMPSLCQSGWPVQSGGAGSLWGGPSLCQSSQFPLSRRYRQMGLCQHDGLPADPCTWLSSHLHQPAHLLNRGRDTPTHCWAGVSCPLSLAHGNVGSPARWSLWPRLSAPAVYWRGVLKWEPGGRSPISAQPLTGSGKFAFSLRASVSSSVKWGGDG